MLRMPETVSGAKDTVVNILSALAKIYHEESEFKLSLRCIRHRLSKVRSHAISLNSQLESIIELA